jgi:osmoprotectant transport system substrate-binding protein
MKPSTLPRERLSSIGLAGLVLIAAACSSSSSTKTSTTATSSPTQAATVASKLVLGGPPECQKNAFCIPGLQKTYGITFSSFKSLDADGPLTYAALTNGNVQVGEVFSTDGLIADKGLVVLQDDKHSQAADNIVPVIRNGKATAPVTALLNTVSAHITTEGLTALNKKVTVDKADAAEVATQYLKDNSLDTTSTAAAGVSLTVASFNFSESVLLADIYGKALQAAGAKVTFKNNLGTRQVIEPGLQSGQIDLVPEYAASALEFLDHSAGLASGDTTNNVTKLQEQFTSSAVTVLVPSPAIDTNAFAVTKATADKYHLAKMSDLANAAP